MNNKLKIFRVNDHSLARATRTKVGCYWYPQHEVARKLLPNNYSIALDVGCGEGLWLNSLSKEKVGLEIDRRKAKIARERGYNIIVGDVHSLPFKKEIFDLVTFLEVIEHLDSPIQALREISRVLETNGKLILTTPNLQDPLRILFNLVPHKIKPWTKTYEIHFEGWDYITLRDLLFHVGFEVEKRLGDVVRPFPTSIAKAVAKLIPSSAFHIAVRASKR